jgi:hypothetical protein
VSTDPAQTQALTSLPTLEQLPRSSGGGYEPDGQASTMVSRAQEGAEKLLTAAGLGPEAAGEVATAIIDAANATGETRPPSSLSAAPTQAPTPIEAPAPTEAQDESE